MKAFARELSWFFIAILLATPVAFLFGYIMGLEPEGVTLTKTEEVFQMELFLIGAVLAFVSTYLMRIIIWAFSKYLINKSE